MSKILLVEKSYDETTESYKKLSHYFKEYGEFFCNVMTPAQKAQKFALYAPDENIPGFTGTLSSAIWQADLVFTNIDESFKNYGSKLKLTDIFDRLYKDRTTNKEDSGMLSCQYREIKSGLIHDSAILYVNVCELTKKLNDTYRDYASPSQSSTPTNSTPDLLMQTPNTHGKIFQSVNKMVISNKISKLYAQYIHSVSDYISYRESIKQCNQEITEYTHSHHINLNRIDDTIFQNFLTIILPKVCKNISQLGQEIIDQANIFQSKIDQINFEADFKEYINVSKLSFKDIKAPRFEPYKFRSPFASPNQIYIQRIKVNYFPIGNAVALSDFDPETKNEVKLTKGKPVYLMEKEPRNGWMLVMTLPLAKIGFVPFSYLKILSDNLELNNENMFNKNKLIKV